MDALATMADLSARGIDTTNATRVTALLDAASASIRDAAGCPISRATSTITLAGSLDRWLPIPLSTVRSVSDVTLDGRTITDAVLRDGRLWRPCGWQSICEPSQITMSVDHGLDDVPADIVDLCCSLVAAGLASAEDEYDPQRGLVSFGVDDYREGYAQGENEVINPFELSQRTREWLRDRFGTGVSVVGSY